MPHRRRPLLSRRHPVHVTLRVVAGVPLLRRPRVMRWIRRCIGLGHKAFFSVVHFSVMRNHLHLIVEAQDRHALARGMQGLKVRFAKRLNKLFARRGALFSERYHARQIRTPSEAHAALGYVLNNVRRHAAQAGRRIARGWLDPCSSAPCFDGWSGHTFTTDAVATTPVTRAPRTWLLRIGWRRAGPLPPDAIPAAA